MRLRKTVPLLALGATAALVVAGTSGAAPGGGGKQLRTFGTGEVTATASSATIVIDSGEFGGVFDNGKGQTGKRVGDVVYAFTSRGDVGGGAPRWALPINDGDFDPFTDFAAIDAAGCGAVVGDNPSNDATLVSTQNPACHVNFHNTDYANWTAFATANPTFTIAKGQIPFIISDAVPPPQTSATYVVTETFFR